MRTIPENAILLNARVDSSGTAFINFDQGLLKYHPGGSASEMATVYSLTNTLAMNIPAIKRVKILVDGKELETLKGHLDARFPFTPNPELITQTQAG